MTVEDGGYNGGLIVSSFQIVVEFYISTYIRNGLILIEQKSIAIVFFQFITI